MSAYNDATAVMNCSVSFVAMHLQLHGLSTAKPAHCHCASTWRGPYIQGPAGRRFIYLSWGTIDPKTRSFTLFRRAKLWFDAIPPTALKDAVELGTLVARSN